MSDQNLPSPSPARVGQLLKDPGNRKVLQALLATDERGLDRFIAVAFQTIVRAPHLLACDPMSLIVAVKDAAALKLSVDGPLGQAWIVPYKGKAQMQLGYKGIVALAQRSGSVLSIDAGVVWKWDRYTLKRGTDERLEIEAAPPPDDANLSDIENITLAYAIARLRGGTNKLAVVWRKELLLSRERSQAYRNALKYGKTDAPWIQHPGPMSAKTAIHRLGKQLELSADDMRALYRDEERDEGRATIDVKGAVSPAGLLQSDSDVTLDELMAQPITEEEMRRADAAYDAKAATVKPAKDPKGGGKLFVGEDSEDPA